MTDALDTNPYDAELSALVDTWQRRFNLELQRALEAESELRETREALALCGKELENWRAEGTVRYGGVPESPALTAVARLPTEEENDGNS